MTSNRSATPSIQRTFGGCCGISYSPRTITPTTHGWTANYTASIGRLTAFSAIKRQCNPAFHPLATVSSAS